MRQAGLSEVF
jgi:hypothetical protein